MATIKNKTKNDRMLVQRQVENSTGNISTYVTGRGSPKVAKWLGVLKARLVKGVSYN